jgi:NAD(P)-dependent dehydrogenase (short-subunit alcohol dehydrogenase family)
VKLATIFGASGGLARALATELLSYGWHVDAVCRAVSAETVSRQFASHINDGDLTLQLVNSSYTEYSFPNFSQIIFITQALFDPIPLAMMTAQNVSDEVMVGLTDPLNLARVFLQKHPSISGVQRNICFIGSTSAYAGYKNTSVYCAVKHGLLGFVRALNDEYALTDDRFWLFSMGTMKTDIGSKVQGQDSSTYLEPSDVAKRIVASILSPTNLFEPEVVIRRRTVGFL